MPPTYHWYMRPAPVLAVSATKPPGQKVVSPTGVIIAVEVFTVTV